ncbi:Heterokaryon incompatibility protein 6, OR allele [Lachnellula arida]|uniref:Heterokaryon incompatibility protein 6, OR allele n=1 Tax=Lachnellula arida TaxID=1316785 RepID=A0A8T9BRG5_9HELO|nr:Heterokaryon incompatibility protein 6, OR allele [Lachnellula arida]
MNDFVYKPLLNGDIRLINLLPGSGNDTIKLLISHQAFPETLRPEYEALSYVWGTFENAGSVGIRQESRDESKIDHHRWHELTVTQNLEVALRNLRLPRETRQIWVDALCINQKDKDEKGVEVARMGIIYRHAKSVIIWLGPEADKSDLAIQRLGLIARDIKEQEDILDAPQNLRLQWSSGLPGPDTYLIQESAKVQQTWSTRLWVYQETHRATRAEVVVGSAQLSWKAFYRAIAWIRSVVDNQPQSIVTKTFNHVALTNLVDTWRKPGRNWSLLGILMSTRSLNCFEPRDRFFAILSFLDKSSLNLDLRPDYSSPVEAVCQAWTLLSIGTGDLDILQLCSAESTDAPSWVVNPTSIKGLPEFMHVYYDAASLSRHETVPRGEGHWKDPKETAVLHIQGVIIGNIAHVTSPCHLNASKAAIRLVCLRWQDQVSAWNDSPSEIKMEDFAVTVVAELFHGRSSRCLPAGMGPTEFCRISLEKVLTGTQNLDTLSASYFTKLQATIEGRSFFVDKNGYMGICPASVLPGDKICVALGKSKPLILREVLPEKRHYRLVGGQCFVRGYMNGEALLGQLPSGWSFQWDDKTGRKTYFQQYSRAKQEDPRSGPLPESYEFVYSSGGKMDSFEYNEYGSMQMRYFLNRKTLKESVFDPRMTVEALRSRGTVIEDIYLI